MKCEIWIVNALTLQNLWKLKALDPSLAGLVIELEILLADITLDNTQLE